MRPDDIPQPNYDDARAYTVTGRTLNGLLKALQRRTPKPGREIRIQEDMDGFSIHSTAETATLCPLGSISITGPTEATISGSVVMAGPDLHDIPPHSISTAVDREELLWLDMDITANIEDGFLLPGIASTSAPTWGNGASYPPHTIPTSPSAEGTAIIPIGYLVVAGGVPTLYPAGCGTVTVAHCPGSLTITRTPLTSAPPDPVYY